MAPKKKVLKGKGKKSAARSPKAKKGKGKKKK